MNSVPGASHRPAFVASAETARARVKHRAHMSPNPATEGADAERGEDASRNAPGEPTNSDDRCARVIVVAPLNAMRDATRRTLNTLHVVSSM